MARAFQLLRHAFEVAGAIQLMAAAGLGAVLAGVIGSFADFPLLLRIVVLVGVFLVTGSAILALFDWWRARNTVPPASSDPEVVLASSGPEGDLLLELLREEWHNQGHLAHVVEAQLRITSRSSSTKGISGWGVGMQFALKLQSPGSAAEVERFADTLRQTKPQIQHRNEVPPGGHVEGWFVVVMDFGPPEYQLIVYDELNNAYRIHRSARESQAHG